MPRASSLLLVLFSLASLPAQAEPAAKKPVDIALVLAVDVSDSVSEAEYKTQREGIIGALSDREVGEMLEGCNRNGIALSYTEWSGKTDEWESVKRVGWQKVKKAKGLQSFAAEVLALPARAFASGTDVSRALQHSASLLEESPFAADRKIIAISSDGQQNIFHRDRYNLSPGAQQLNEDLVAARDAILARDISISALVVENETHYPEIADYYARFVTGGSASFVEPVKDYPEFRAGLKKMLMRELSYHCQF